MPRPSLFALALLFVLPCFCFADMPIFTSQAEVIANDHVQCINNNTHLEIKPHSVQATYCPVPSQPAEKHQAVGIRIQPQNPLSKYRVYVLDQDNMWKMAFQKPYKCANEDCHDLHMGPFFKIYQGLSITAFNVAIQNIEEYEETYKAYFQWILTTE
eukprot:gnl/Trimastix_PCT/4202.p2 GENE.gnl/Trimastix_PCT/4202~~gnl/Trimastix_PCT/4202.p2  ORF type:complete len:157 (+),score=23.46 gnl/Trimastix_PCT/4202:31-501(+)